MDNLEKIFKIRPAFDKRNADPKKNYGIHCVEVWMVLKGKAGAVHFGFTTGMFLPETMKEYAANGQLNPKELSPGHWFYLYKPMGIDVGYHSPKKMWDGQQVNHPTKMKVKGKKKIAELKMGEILENVEFEKVGKNPPICDYLGVPCFSDGSALRAEEWFDVLLRKGSDEIWKMLAIEYVERFN